MEAIIENKVSHFLQNNLSPIGNYFLRAFLGIHAGEGSFSAQWKRIFLINPSFWLVESEFLSIGNSILLFRTFFLLVEIIISSKICFHQPKIRISLKNTFPLDGKKTDRGLRKMEKEDDFHQQENQLSTSGNIETFTGGNVYFCSEISL